MLKKVLVTGGAGFIGSHLCEALARKADYEVFSLDNYSTGSRDNHVDGVSYIKGETSDIDNLINFTPDFLYHLGEYSRVEQSFGEIEKLYQSNIHGTFRVLQFAQKNKCKFVYAGSSTKFGDGGLGRHQSPYGWTKASNSDLVDNYMHWYGLNAATVYFYNAYGPREINSGKYATLIAIFVEQMRKHGKLTVVSPGSQLRNFTHVYDIVKGLVLVGELGVGGDYGIGNDKSHSIIDIANAFGGDINMLPERPGNRMSAVVRTDKTKSLGWSAKMDVMDYIIEAKEQGFLI